MPYLYGRGSFISYDDPTSMAAKAELARDYNSGGIGFWELSQDTVGELVSAACQAWGAEQRVGCWDVPPSAWYADAVVEVSAAGLMQGTGAGLFSPGGTSAGYRAVPPFAYRLAGEPKAPDIPFSDVSASDYYGDAVAWAAKPAWLPAMPTVPSDPSRRCPASRWRRCCGGMPTGRTLPWPVRRI
mgnify:CR=1 FL=1